MVQDRAEAVSAARKLLVETGLDLLQLEAKVKMAQATGRERQRTRGNSLAREAFLQRFDGTQIDTVFAPGEYHIPE